MDTLRSVVQSLAANLPKPINDVLHSQLGPICHRLLLHDLDLTTSASTGPCLRLAISKTLGVGIILSASIVKIPQILKLLSSRSAAGLSFLSYLLETVSFIISLAYNARSGFPFSTYGETAMIAVQNIVISVLVLHFRGRAPAAAAFVAGVASLVYLLLGRADLVGSKALAWLQAGAAGLGVASKAPQVWTIWKEGGTGQLSAFAVWLFPHLGRSFPWHIRSPHLSSLLTVWRDQVFSYLLGSLSRIFTTVQEVDDKLVLAGYVTSFVLNAVLAAQMLYYWNSSSSGSARAKSRGAAGTGQGRLQPQAWAEKNDGNPAVAAFASPAGLTTGSAAQTSRGKSPSTRRRG